MPARSRPLAVAIAAALAAGGAALALRPVPVLELRNEARGRTVSFPVPGGGPFEVISQHSMYDQPVTEEFVVGPGDELVLAAVSSPSAAVREYFGLTAAGERQVVHRAMRQIVFRIAAGAPQRLRVGGEERSFLDLGDHGDRLVLTASSSPALTRWLALLFRSPGPHPP
jgi:hypothetical protein